MRWLCLLKSGGGSAARLAWAHAKRCGPPIGMGDDAGRHHVGAVADPRRVVADGRGGDAEFIQVIEPANPGPVTPDAGVVENRRDGMQLRRAIGCIDTAMRGVDDDRACGFRPDAGDAVGGNDWSGHRCLPRVVIAPWRARAVAHAVLAGLSVLSSSQ
jgi:hypothetical protein